MFFDLMFLVLRDKYNTMPLRKIVLSSSTLTDNARSFTNLTDKRLHIRKIRGYSTGSSTGQVVGDQATSSLDEVPVSQEGVNDSRSHIASTMAEVAGATGAVAATHTVITLAFNRGDLFLDVDEALFMNNQDVVGAMAWNFGWSIWYED